VLSALQPGEVRKGRITSLSDYGAFVDLGGVNGLVHLSELSWHRVRRPADVVSVGDEVDVKVLDVKVKKRRVSLSMRQVADDPLAGLVPGEIRTGPVTRLVDFGAFVDLSGVEGLVHLSELAEHRVSAPEEIVAPGEEVRVKVLSVDRRRRRVELSIRRAAEYGG
jgi:small subunit ribosomal protein S1